MVTAFFSMLVLLGNEIPRFSLFSAFVLLFTSNNYGLNTLNSQGTWILFLFLWLSFSLTLLYPLLHLHSLIFLYQNYYNQASASLTLGIMGRQRFVTLMVYYYHIEHVGVYVIAP